MFVAFTMDVDPDANRAVEGRPDAVTAGGEGGVRMDGCREGLEWIAEIMEQTGLPCTFFWETRTLLHLSESDPDLLDRLRDNTGFEHACHGLRHEDFSGKVSGQPLDADATRDTVEEAIQGFQKVFGERPEGFRAPYCRLTDDLISTLAETGFRYDASRTVELQKSIDLMPSHLTRKPRTLWEIPLCRWRDSEGQPISGYLWQLMEGRRTEDDYLTMLGEIADSYRTVLVQVALHPWHLRVRADGQRLSNQETRANREKLGSIIWGLLRMDGLHFSRVGNYLDGLSGECRSCVERG